MHLFLDVSRGAGGGLFMFDCPVRILFIDTLQYLPILINGEMVVFQKYCFLVMGQYEVIRAPFVAMRIRGFLALR